MNSFLIGQFLILSLVTITIKTRPTLKQTADQIFAAKYLAKFGYLSSSHHGMDQAVTKFQVFAGLKETGELDKETMEHMKMKRCGMKDPVDGNINSRHKRYALQGSRWGTRNITYRVAKYPTTTRLTKDDVDRTLQEAFSIWEKHTNLKFKKKQSGDVLIKISFERNDHGDDDPFDGFGGTLAHAFFPIYGGDAHFDEEEDWTVNSYRGTSLLMTAAHELGHSLGLSHSNVPESLMTPFYRGFVPDLDLHGDDVEGIQQLYGVKTRDSVNTRNDSLKVDTEDICKTKKVDAIVTLNSRDTYVFVGTKYWKLGESSIEPGYPRLISEEWGGLPSNIDAAFTWENGKTYFFKGSQYWRLSEAGLLDRGYPKDMKEGFQGAPSDIDAALLWPADNKIYFFKGDNYWKFDPQQRPFVDSSYPRKIKGNWKGIPGNLDSAMQYSNGKTYFFKKGKYFRFDDRKRKVDDSAEPSYPRDIGMWWFGCEKGSLPLRKYN